MMMMKKIAMVIMIVLIAEKDTDYHYEQKLSSTGNCTRGRKKNPIQNFICLPTADGKIIGIKSKMFLLGYELSCAHIPSLFPCSPLHPINLFSHNAVPWNGICFVFLQI